MVSTGMRGRYAPLQHGRYFRQFVSAMLFGLFLLGVMLAPPLAQAEDSAKEAKKDIVLQGDAKCTRCHDENESYPVLSIGKTRHGVMGDGRLPSCAGCHGESETHINKPEGVKERPKPEFPFGKKTAGDIRGHNQVCTDCHKGGKFMLWGGSAHDSRGVACTDCHKLHVAEDKVRDKLTQPEVCFACHKEQRVLAGKPSHHPILEGKVACSDCHASHGAAGPKLMKRDSVADTCYTCHMEKRGPFIRKHEPAEDCSICHNPHGSSVDNLLKTRPPFLCQQCHEPTSHRGGIPGLAAGTGASSGTRGITQARACLNCHTNIHGSNNPANIGNERTFRR